MRTVGNPRIPEILVEVEGDFLCACFLIDFFGTPFFEVVCFYLFK